MNLFFLTLKSNFQINVRGSLETSGKVFLLDKNLLIKRNTD